LEDWGRPKANGKSAGQSEETLDAIRKSERTGRPLGSAKFVKRLETKLGRMLAR